MLKQMIKKHLRDYRKYRPEIIEYTIEVQRKLSKHNAIMFCFYGIYMHITGQLIWDVHESATMTSLFVAGVSLIDYVLFKYYLPKHPDMVITAANIYIFLILKGLNSVYNILPGVMSYVLIVCSVVTTAMINIAPFQYRAIMTVTTLSGLIEYFLMNPGAPFIDVLTRVTDDVLILAFTIGINTVFSKLKYDEINHRQTLTSESVTDPLTKLFNRKYMEHYVELHIDTSELCAMVLIDLDNFKAVNDTFGHGKGDEVLCQIADILGNYFRRTDCVARLGGDEFMVFLTGVSTRETVMKRVQDCLKAFPLVISEGGAEKVEVSASIGVAFSEAQENMSYEKLYKTSDAVMYKAKQSGKAKAVTAEDAVMKEMLVTKEEIRES